MPRCADALKVSLGSRTRDTKIGRGALFLLWDRTQKTRADAPQVRSQIWIVMLRRVMGSTMLACKSWRPQQMFRAQMLLEKVSAKSTKSLRNWHLGWGPTTKPRNWESCDVLGRNAERGAGIATVWHGSRTHWGWMNTGGAATKSPKNCQCQIDHSAKHIL